MRGRADGGNARRAILIWYLKLSSTIFKSPSSLLLAENTLRETHKGADNLIISSYEGRGGRRVLRNYFARREKRDKNYLGAKRTASYISSGALRYPFLILGENLSRDPKENIWHPRSFSLAPPTESYFHYSNEMRASVYTRSLRPRSRNPLVCEGERCRHRSVLLVKHAAAMILHSGPSEIRRDRLAR